MFKQGEKHPEEVECRSCNETVGNCTYFKIPFNVRSGEKVLQLSTLAVFICESCIERRGEPIEFLDSVLRFKDNLEK